MIRPATPSDLPAIVAIYNESIAGHLATADTEPLSVAERVGWFAEHATDSYPIYVEAEGEDVIGWTGLDRFYGRPAYRRTAEVSTYVATARQGEGIGSRLRAHVLEACPALGFDTLLSFVFAHNPVSIHLNEKFGFGTWGRLPRVAVLDGIERDLLIMGRRIEP